MSELSLNINTALSGVPVNLVPLVDYNDGKTIKTNIAYNSGITLNFNFVNVNGNFTSTAVTPASGGDYLWTHQGGGMYTVQIPAVSGASINNNSAGFGWFVGEVSGATLPFRGPTITFRDSGLNSALVTSAYSTTQGLAGTNLDAAISSRSTAGNSFNNSPLRQMVTNATGVISHVFISDPSGVGGTGKVGLTAAGLALSYVRSPNALPSSVALTNIGVTSGWTSGGFVELSSGNMPGMYRLDLPDAAFSYGSDLVTFLLHGTGIAPTPISYELLQAISSVSGTVYSTVSGIVSSNIIQVNGSTFAGNAVPANLTHRNGIAVANDYGVAFDFSDHNADAKDIWTAVFYRDGQFLPTGISSPRLSVVNHSGSILINSGTLTERNSDGVYQYVASAAERITDGIPVTARFDITVDGANRVIMWPNGRDSANA